MTQLISIWGKGGVGKSSCAAAIAYSLAVNNYSVILVTTDYVPTISKIFGARERCMTQINDIPSLYIFEVTPNEVVRMWKETFGEEVYRVISSILPVGREILDYIAGAPGLGDEFMLYIIYQKFSENEADYIVWDLPAAGDALRLLYLEKQFYEHLNDAARLYLRLKGFLSKLKRKKAPSPLELINKWRELANYIFKMLSSNEHKAILISTPEPLSIEVSKRIISDLEIFGINLSAIIVNMVLSKNLILKDVFSEKIKLQEKIIRNLKEIAANKKLMYLEVPYLTTDLSTYKNLNEFCKEIQPLIEFLMMKTKTRLK